MKIHAATQIHAATPCESVGTCCRRFRKRFFQDESGILTQEWTFLLMVMVIGIVGGAAILRDVLVVRFFYASDALGAVNPSYAIEAYESRLTDEHGVQLYEAVGSNYGSEANVGWVSINP